MALTGALVGGISARRRKQELEHLNEQLRTINSQLRQQARAGTLYAPGLTYAPPSLGRGDPPSPSSNGSAPNGAADQGCPAATLTLPRQPGTSAPPQFSWPEPSPAMQEAAEAAAAAVHAVSPTPLTVGVSVVSLDEDDMRPEAKQCLQV